MRDLVHFRLQHLTSLSDSMDAFVYVNGVLAFPTKVKTDDATLAQAVNKVLKIKDTKMYFRACLNGKTYIVNLYTEEEIYRRAEDIGIDKEEIPNMFAISV